MANQDFRSGATEASWLASKKPIELRATLDFSSTNVSASDVCQALNLKAGYFGQVFLRVTTAEGGTATADVKTDETTPQVFLEAVDLNVAGLKYGDTADGDAAPLPLYIGEDCVLGIVPDNALDAAVVQVIFVGYDFRDTP
jgi:hypothetical protein